MSANVFHQQQIDRAKAIESQYYKGGGFCGECGNARLPFVTDLPKDIVEDPCTCFKTFKPEDFKGTYEYKEEK